MYKQLDIFSFLNQSEEKLFCWDDDINEIHSKLVGLSNKYGFKIDKQEWDIWDHVPQYGYRMTFNILIDKNKYTEDFLQKLHEIVEFADGRNIELSPVAPYFYSNDNNGHMFIFSTFKDKERRKRR